MNKTVWAAIGAAGVLAFAGSASAVETFGYTGSIQTWSVAETGVYHFDVWGAGGGGGSSPFFSCVSTGCGGLGAYLGGDIQLTAGTFLSIVVGGRGTLASNDANLALGGGGGTWIYVDAAAQPLAVAGGGAGANWPGGIQAASGTIASGDGSGGEGQDGGGGAGWLGSGTDGGPPRDFSHGDYPIGTGGHGPTSFTGGRTIGCDNGQLIQCGDHGPSGGFGGGGGGGWVVGGGGGGYTGGDAGMGGTSYLDGGFYNVAATAGARAGNGLVTINFVGVPEPSTWSMMLLGFFGLGAALRRRYPKLAVTRPAPKA